MLPQRPPHWLHCSRSLSSPIHRFAPRALMMSATSRTTSCRQAPLCDQVIRARVDVADQLRVGDGAAHSQYCTQKGARRVPRAVLTRLF